MVVPSAGKAENKEIAVLTRQTSLGTVPAAMPGIIFKLECRIMARPQDSV